MKQNLNSLFLAFSLGALVFSCSPKSSTDANKASLTSSKQNEAANAEKTDSIPTYVVKDTGPFQDAKPKLWDLTHTSLNVKFNWDTKQLIGEAELYITPHFYLYKEMEIDAVGFDIARVEVLKKAKKPVAVPFKHQYDGKKLKINLENTPSAKDTFIVEIDYTANPERNPSGGSAAITSDKGLYFINADDSEGDKPKQIWTQGETQASSKWFPTFDRPNERCTQEIAITVDKKYKTLSNGLLTYSLNNNDGTRTDKWVLNLPHAPYLFMMAIGEFSVVNDKKWNGLEVSYYVEPKFEPYAKGIFGKTPKMLDFFSSFTGVKYPWPKYSQVVVRDYVSGAMENTSASLFMEAVQIDDREQLDRDWNGIIAHELFHQWFGDYVTCKSWSNLPMNESFANYSEYLWAEHDRGKDFADLEVLDDARDGYFGESERKQVPVIRFNYHNQEDMFDAHSYNKGGLILHYLRYQVGDEAFKASLKKYLTTNAFSDVDYKDLQKAFESVTGRDLTRFFNEFLLSAGHPELSVTVGERNNLTTTTISQTQDTRFTPLYTTLKIPVAKVYFDGKIEEFAVDLKGKDTTLTSDGSSFFYAVDMDMKIPGKVFQEYSAKEIRTLVEKSKYGIARYNALASYVNADAATLADVLPIGLADTVATIRAAALQIANQKLDSVAKMKLLPSVNALLVKEKSTQVKAEILNFLGSLRTEANRLKVKEFLTAKSYKVEAAAWDNYLAMERPEIATALAKQQAAKNNSSNLAMSLGKFFTANKVEGMAPFFTEGIKSAKGQNAYALQTTFLDYVVAFNKEELTASAIAMFTKTLNDSKDIYARLGAFQSLVIIKLRFNKDDTINPILNAALEAETNEQLKMYFNYLNSQKAQD